MGDAHLRLPEEVVPGRRLGRHVNHDPRSLRFALPAGKPATVRWQRVLPVLDQGNLGSCTGNALVGALGTGPLYDGLTSDERASLGEQLAVALYSDATGLDGFDGSYPPTDTGSDGLSVAKAAQKRGLTPGYTHATSLDACYTAIAAGPFITGVAWWSGMDSPTSEGVVHATGRIRGGHEFEVVGYDATTGLWEAVNSWGDSWGRGGHFYIPDEDYARLLADQGDATSILPLTSAPPVPTPPAPPVSPPHDPPTALLAHLAAWSQRPHAWHDSTQLAQEARQWLNP